MRKPTDRQEILLTKLKRWEREGFIASGHLADVLIANPGAILKRMEARGWVESNGVVMPEGRVYRITEDGKAALDA